MDSKALTKIQSVALIAIIAVAAVGGSLAYMFSRGPAQSAENIRIGVCADLDNAIGKPAFHGVVLAIEQINAQGGVLGRNLTVVAEDDDSESTGGDISIGTNAMTKLITVDKADCIVTPQATNALLYQDLAAEHKTIIFSIRATVDSLTQRVLDNYDKYKYYFRVYPANATQTSKGLINSLINLGNITGFNKVAYLATDLAAVKPLTSGMDTALPASGFDLVYKGFITPTTTDFTSYLAAVEASGAQILVPLIFQQGTASFVKEWCDRQSPFVLWGPMQGGSEKNFWNLTEGKCEYLSVNGLAATVGYPLTNKTLLAYETYIQRWGANPTSEAIAAYDAVRYILTDAIERAGTTETEALIKALETTNVETSMARHYIFTSSHDVAVTFADPNNPTWIAEQHMLVITFQWQDGAKQVPVGPAEIMEEAGATYKFPPWHGPWDKTQTP